MTSTSYDQTRLYRSLFGIALLFIFVGLLMLSGSVRAAGPYVVNSPADNPDVQLSDGQCLPNTVCTLRAAIQRANATSGLEEITFAPTFTFPLTIPISPTLVITDGVTINGPGASLLTLDGGGQNQIFSIDSTSGPVNILNLTFANGGPSGQSNGASIIFTTGDDCCDGPVALTDQTLNLTNIIIRDGSASYGAALYVDVGAYSSVNLFVNIRDSTLSNNSAEGDGGAIYITNNSFGNNSGTVNITNSILSGNNSEDGAAIFNDNGNTVNINNSTLNGNISNDGDGGVVYNQGALNITNSALISNTSDGDAGAIYNESDAMLSIINSSLSENSSDGDGGAIYNEGASILITTTILSGNSTGSSGGAISNESGALLNIINSSLSGNSSDGDGGAIYNDDGSMLNVSNTTLNGNHNNGDGGAIYNGIESTMNITNTTLSGNSTTGNGGAIVGTSFFSTYTLSIRNSTIVNNKATAGGGVYQFRGASSFAPTVQIANTIIAGNTISGTTNFDDCRNLGIGPTGNFTSLGYNLTITGNQHKLCFH